MPMAIGTMHGMRASVPAQMVARTLNCLVARPVRPIVSAVLIESDDRLTATLVP